MRVVSAHVDATVTDQALKPGPDIGLNRLQQIPDVDIRIDVW
jgi:hypothetical protein